MSAALKEVVESAKKLPIEDQISLVEQLIASMDDRDLEEEWSREALRRYEEIKNGTAETISAEELFKKYERY